MSTAWVIASRELRGRARLFIVAAAMAVIPFVVAAMPGARTHRGMAIATLAGVLAVTYSLALALAQGVSTIGRDLAEKRLSFYFAKPVAPGAIWLGKVLAALATCAGVAAIIVAPALLVSVEEWRASWAASGRMLLLLTAIGCVALFFASHIISTMVRSRSVLIALDFVLAALTALCAVLIVRPLLVAGVIELATVLSATMAGACLLAAGLAPAWQLAQGRTDVRRSHIALSKFLWPAFGVVLAIAGLTVAWLTSTTYASIDELYDLQQTATGDRIIVTGGDDARLGMPATFVVDAKSGDARRLPNRGWSSAQFSRDGSAVAWRETAELLPGAGGMLVVAPTNGAGKGAAIPHPAFTPFVLSDDGSRVALLDRTQVRVYESASGRLLAVVNDFAPRHMFFASNDSLLLIDSGGRAAGRVAHLDIARRKLTPRARIDSALERGRVTASADGTRLYASKSRTLVDLRTGAQTKLPLENGVMLPDGTVVSIAKGELQRMNAEGKLLARFAMPFDAAWIRGPVGATKLLVSRQREAFLIDLERGTVVQTLKDARLAYAWSSDPRLPRYPDGVVLHYADKQGKVHQMKTAG